MGLYRQYKESLKIVEAEEIFDLIFYRPLAFLFVKAVYSTNLTPNQTSVIAMLFGVLAGVCFGIGHEGFIFLGAFLYLICNILDCADGQIARLKKNGTKVGRIVDGFIDYVVSTAVFAGIAIGLTRMHSSGSFVPYANYLNFNPVLYIWLLCILAGLSSALQSFVFDFYRNMFLEIVYGKVSSPQDEITEFEEERYSIRKDKNKGSKLDLLLIAVYLKYTRLQLKIGGSKNKTQLLTKPDPDNYYSVNKNILRMWSFIGSTTHITACIICALFNNLELFLWICILPFNIILLVLYFKQITIHKRITQAA
jgi:phosphatidylglycerophosphate synthase